MRLDNEEEGRKESGTGYAELSHLYSLLRSHFQKEREYLVRYLCLQIEDFVSLGPSSMITLPPLPDEILVNIFRYCKRVSVFVFASFFRAWWHAALGARRA